MHVMFKATDYCNMDCTYCYVSKEQRKDKRSFPIEHMPAIFDRMFDWQQHFGSTDQLHFNWSGGEVLTLPIDWWQRVFDIQKEVYARGQYTFAIENGIQTNLTLMTDEYFEFLQANHVSIGVTIDGTKDCMDKTRVFWGGHSAFDAVMKKIHRLIEKYGFRPGIIVVLTKHNYLHLEEIYKFFRDLGLSFQINSYHYAPQSVDNDQSNALTSKEYLEVMTRLFDLWSADSGAIDIANFSRVTEFLLHGRTSLCHHAENCTDYFYTVRWDGGVFPCNEFGGESFEEKYCYGNLITDDWRIIRDNASRNALLARNLQLQAIEYDDGGCRGCRYWKGCHGGCLHSTMRDQHRRLRDSSPQKVASLRDTEHCALTFGLYQYIEQRLREESANHLLPLLLFTDRTSPDAAIRKSSFYAVQRSAWQAAIDEGQELSGNNTHLVACLAPLLTDGDQVLQIGCGNGALLDDLLGVVGTENCWTGVEYRRGILPSTRTVGGGELQFCDAVMTWKGWKSDRRWDAILIDPGLIHEEDLGDLLYLCGDRLTSRGSIILCAAINRLNSLGLMEVAECRGVKAYDQDAISINRRGLSVAVLKAPSWTRCDELEIASNHVLAER